MYKLPYVVLVTLIISILGCDCGWWGNENDPPVINSFTASSTEVPTGSEVSLVVLATDPDGDDLTYTYQASAGTITGTGNMATWIAPDLAGSCILTVDVSDGELNSQDLITINVRSLVKPGVPQDSAPMVLIPAGDFSMGSNDGEEDEKPVHVVYIDAFYMDVYEVTNARYQKFMDETGHEAPRYWNDDIFNAPDQPVVGVSWYDAVAYAEWAGKRLPTEAEWEKAARGGLVGKRYPWGDEITHDDANYSYPNPVTGGKDIWEYTSPVGSFAPNGYGLHDMAGNVWEWCADWYDENYYSVSPERNPTGPGSGTNRVVRGGSWPHPPDFLRAASRYMIIHDGPGINSCGFRCVSQD